VHPDEIGYGTVIGFFMFLTEETGWELPISPVVVEAFAASGFSFTGVVGADT
jgi:hypothetical protein